jgi:hypothetical protein
MAMLAFGEWRPDISDLGTQHTRNMRNVVPRADGYGPFRDLTPFTQPLPAACRGYYRAQNEDSSVTIFAGTETKLYVLDNSTFAWVDASLGSSTYSALSTDANWVFAQFNSVVIATQKNAVMQTWTLGSSTAFANLSGSPPQAGWVGVVGRHLVAADLLSDPFSIHWSGLNDVTAWTAGTDQSDVQELPDGGRARAVVEVQGGVGYILQEQALRRMTWMPGSGIIFQIDRVPHGRGTVTPYGVVVAQDGVYWPSPHGFMRAGIDGGLQTIGEEYVDRTFLGKHPTNVPAAIRALAYDEGSQRLVQGAADPINSLVVWVYKGLSGTTGLWNRALIYNTLLKRWSPAEIVGEFIQSASQPGVTLDSLDSVAPGSMDVTDTADNGGGLVRIEVADTSTLTDGGTYTISAVTGTTEANGSWVIDVIDATHFDLIGSAFANAYIDGGVVGGSLDDIPFSLDDVSTATLPNIAAVNSDHELGFFTGDTLEAELETTEQSGDGKRFNINGLRPITDASDVYCAVMKRENLNEEATEQTESAMDGDGNCPVLEEARYARGKARVPAATVWSYASGIEPEIDTDFSDAGWF